MRRLLLLAIVGLGVAISGYLLHRHFALSARDVVGGVDVCSLVFGSGCDDALVSGWAVQFGLPLAGWGIVYYGTLLALLFLGWWLDEAFAFEANLAALLLALLAALASVALFLLMIKGSAPFCPLCAAIHALNLLLLYLLWHHAGVPGRQLLKAVAEAWKDLLGNEPPDPIGSRWKLVGFLAVGLVAAVLFQWVYVEAALRAPRAAERLDPQAVLASFLKEPVRAIPLDSEDPALGPEHAPATLVVFSDLECPACRQFAGEMASLRRRFPDTLRVVFKDFPLDSRCNQAVRTTRHKDACKAAEAAEAARMQGKFWRFYDALLAEEAPLDEQTIERVARQADLDVEPFRRDRTDPSVAAAVAADAALGMRLGVDGTPALFLNGRRVRDIRFGALEIAIGYLSEGTKPPAENTLSADLTQ